MPESSHDDHTRRVPNQQDDFQGGVESGGHGSDELIGKVLSGRYKIIKKLGAGGMSTVYKAEHLLMQRMVALKVMQPRLVQSPKALARFQKEAIVTSRLKHPHIVQVFEFKPPDAEPAYLVMDYVEGHTLQREIKQGPLSIARTLRIASQIADGLDHAHENGVLHRDLKPGNIILTTISGADMVSILDFGIAKILTDEDASRALTHPGDVLGSPLYMSPEQCMGEKPDARADIYSLGCVMFEMLTGKPPYRGDTAFDTIDLHNSAEIPSLQSRRAAEPHLEKIDTVIRKCLAKKPEERFQSMRELKEAIDAITPGASGKQGREKDPRSLYQRTSIIAISVISLLVATAAAVPFLIKQNQPQTSTDSTAPVMGTSSRDEWLHINKLGQLSFNKGHLERASKLFKDAMIVAKNSKDSKEMVFSTAKNLFDLAQFQHKAPSAEVADLMSESKAYTRSKLSKIIQSLHLGKLNEADLSDSDRKQIAIAANNYAEEKLEEGDPESAVAVLGLITDQVCDRWGASSSLAVRTMSNHLIGLVEQDKRSAIPALKLKLTGAVKDHQSIDFLALANAYEAIGQCTFTDFRLRNYTTQCYTTAMALYKKAGATDNKKFSRCLFKFAQFLFGMNDVKECQRYAKMYIEATEPKYKEKDASVLDHLRLSAAYAYLLQRTDASKHSTLALHKAEFAIDQNDLIVGIALYNAAYCQKYQPNKEKFCIPLYRRCLAVSKRMGYRDYPKRVKALLDAFLQLKQYDRAVQFVEQEAQTLPPGRHQDLLNRMALACIDAHMTNEAKDFAQQAVTMGKSREPYSDYAEAFSLLILASAHHAAKEEKEADMYLQKAFALALKSKDPRANELRNAISRIDSKFQVQ